MKESTTFEKLTSYSPENRGRYKLARAWADLPIVAPTFGNQKIKLELHSSMQYGEFQHEKLHTNDFIGCPCRTKRIMRSLEWWLDIGVGAKKRFGLKIKTRCTSAP